MKQEKNSERWDNFTKTTSEVLGELKDNKVLFIACLLNATDLVKNTYPKNLEKAKKVIAISHDLLKNK